MLGGGPSLGVQKRRSYGRRRWHETTHHTSMPSCMRIEWLADTGERPEFVMVLQPTSPLRVSEDIDAAVQLAVARDASAVVSVAEAVTHPFLTVRVTEEGQLADFVPTPPGYLRRQSFPTVYALNGGRSTRYVATGS